MISTTSIVAKCRECTCNSILHLKSISQLPVFLHLKAGPTNSSLHNLNIYNLPIQLLILYPIFYFCIFYTENLRYLPTYLYPSHKALNIIIVYVAAIYIVARERRPRAAQNIYIWLALSMIYDYTEDVRSILPHKCGIYRGVLAKLYIKKHRGPRTWIDVRILVDLLEEFRVTIQSFLVKDYTFSWNLPSHTDWIDM